MEIFEMETKTVKPMTVSELEKLKKLANEYRPGMDKLVVHAWGHDVSILLKSYLARIGEL
jgi:hypothetical protein